MAAQSFSSEGLLGSTTIAKVDGAGKDAWGCSTHHSNRLGVLQKTKFLVFSISKIFHTKTTLKHLCGERKPKFWKIAKYSALRAV